MLKEEVYLKLQDASWRVVGFLACRPIVRLSKSVSGLKQSGRCWIEDISAFMREIGLRQLVSIPAVYNSNKALVIFYLDDIMIIARRDRIGEIVDAFHKRFATKRGVCGSTFGYVGLEIVRDRDKKEIYVNQAGYISRVLTRFGMDQSRGRATPMDKFTPLQASTYTGEPYDQITLAGGVAKTPPKTSTTYSKSAPNGGNNRRSSARRSKKQPGTSRR